MTEEKAEKNPTAENDNAIEFRNVSFSYGEGEALKNVTFSIKRAKLWELSAEPVPVNPHL